MKHATLTAICLAALIPAACSNGADETPSGLMGEWQSADDADYRLKFNRDTYREFYAGEEMSGDHWQPVKSCDDPQPVKKSAQTYGGFQIWTKETDDRICYVISNWTADQVSLTYAGTTSAYARVN